jgi:hypothetical protein
MRCDEIREYFVDLLYSEAGTQPANLEIQDHLRTCPECRREFEELKQTRNYLQKWEDEFPLRSVTIARHEKRPIKRDGWKYLRYAAVAAMVFICILALANTEISVTKSRFSISTHIFPAKAPERDYYTKNEVREILNESESQMKEINYIMAKRLLDTVEQEQYMNLRLTHSRSSQDRNRN